MKDRKNSDKSFYLNSVILTCSVALNVRKYLFLLGDQSYFVIVVVTEALSVVRWIGGKRRSSD